ncbi:MAG: hypothetical protein HYY92_02785, partial [Parcubacteria group bacterium]|nr:hypothetical protein [Parcubacteria group bacterium]
MYETVTVLGAKTFRAVASFFGVYAPTDFSSPTEETDKPPRLAQFPQQSETMKEAHVSTPSALEQEIAILRREIASLKNKSVVIESSPDYKTLTETVDTILASYALGGLTEAAVEAKLNALENNFRIAMAGITGNTTANDATYRAVALSNRIDNLGSVTLNNTTVTGTFEGLTDTHIPDTITASLYLPLTGGTLTGTFTGTSASFDTLTVSSLSATSSDASIFIQASTTRLSIFDTLFIGGTATTTIGGDNATSTFASRIIASRAPSLAHTFNVWAVDDPAAAVLDAPFVVNPASAAADTNLFGIAVNDSAKFIVDAEGDIFANSLTTEGSVTVGATTMASLIVENNTTLGDASGDVVTINAGTINFATSTLAFSGAATTTIPNLLTNAWSIATSTTNTPVFTISTEASPFGLIGIGTTSPGTLLAVQGDVFINDLLTVGGAVNATSTLTVGDLSTLAGFISTASSTIGGPFYVQDNLSASSTLTVAGLATLEDGAILGGASSTVSGTLDVTGLSALAGFISSASSTVSAPFHVSDNLSASSTLTVASLATFDSGFISSASSSVSAPLHISDIIAGSSTLVTDQSAYFALQSGSVGIASSTPWGLLSVEMNTTDPAFVVSNQGSSTPSFYIGGV